MEIHNRYRSADLLADLSSSILAVGVSWTSWLLARVDARTSVHRDGGIACVFSALSVALGSAKGSVISRSASKVRRSSRVLAAPR